MVEHIRRGLCTPGKRECINSRACIRVDPLSLVAFSFMLPPLLKKPPEWALPDPTRNSQWYGEIWIKYPLNNGPSPSYFSHIFRARCQFRIIMNEICDAAYSEGSGITLDKAHRFRERLESWYKNLPVPLQPRTIVLPGHLQLQ